MTDLLLAPDVFVCVTQGHGVFLDLARDKYSAILLSSTADDASCDPSPTTGMLAQSLTDQRDALLAASLLTTDPNQGRRIGVATADPIEGHIFGLDDQRAFGLVGEASSDLRIGLRELFDFFTSSWKASRDLKRKHIAQIAAAVRRRKESGRAQIVDPATLSRSIAIFRRLRPFYPRPYLCLYDSLALVEFLARRGLYPLWIFAVQAQPFGAHCWVQSGGLLLNEGSEYAGQFTPIMTI
jgi:hypothetical protein